MSNDVNSLVDNVLSNIAALEGGDTYQVTRIKDHKHKTAPYFGIGRKGHTAYYDPVIKQKIFTEGLDVTNIFLQLNPITLAVFWKLVSLRDTRTNVINLAQHGFTVADKNRLKKCFRELLNHQLVCRIKRGYLLINPKAIIPDYSFYESVELRWDQLNTRLPTNNHTDPNTNSIKSTESIDTRKLSLSSAGMMTAPIEFDDDDEAPPETAMSIKKRKLTL